MSSKFRLPTRMSGSVPDDKCSGVNDLLIRGIRGQGQFGRTRRCDGGDGVDGGRRQFITGQAAVTQGSPRQTLLSPGIHPDFAVLDLRLPALPRFTAAAICWPL